MLRQTSPCRAFALYVTSFSRELGDQKALFALPAAVAEQTPGVWKGHTNCYTMTAIVSGATSADPVKVQMLRNGMIEEEQKVSHSQFPN